jgi:hypothetical protein
MGDGASVKAPGKGKSQRLPLSKEISMRPACRYILCSGENLSRQKLQLICLYPGQMGFVETTYEELGILSCLNVSSHSEWIR